MPADKSVLEELRRINSSILEIRHGISVNHHGLKPVASPCQSGRYGSLLHGLKSVAPATRGGSVEHRLTKLEEKATSYEALKQNMSYMIVAVLGLILAQLIGITFRLPNFI